MSVAYKLYILFRLRRPSFRTSGTKALRLAPFIHCFHRGHGNEPIVSANASQ
jgi:hypothetical protein